MSTPSIYDWQIADEVNIQEITFIPTASADANFAVVGYLTYTLKGDQGLYRIRDGGATTRGVLFGLLDRLNLPDKTLLSRSSRQIDSQGGYYRFLRRHRLVGWINS